jgi:arylsulfatase
MDPQQRGRKLPNWTRTLPQYLKPAGYRSYHSGKWHVSAAPRQVQDAGFDHSYALEDQNRFFDPRNHTEDDKHLPPVKREDGYYATTAITDYALKYLKEHATQHGGDPFFLYLAYTSPHFPLHAPAEDIARYKSKYLEGWEVIRQRRYEKMQSLGLVNCPLSKPEPDIKAPSGGPDTLTKLDDAETLYAAPWESLTPQQKEFQAMKMAIHAAMIDRMDQEVGRVLAQLKTMNAMENTLIFFLSDNGASAEILVRGDGHDHDAPMGSAASYLCLGPGWATACNTPFRRHKIWVHEGGISTPLLVHWPTHVAARGELRHNTGHVIDILPTILDVAGVKPEPQWNNATAPPFPGKSLVPAFAKDGAVTRASLYFNHERNSGLRMENWKIVRDDPSNPWELYDLSKDRNESTNLADKDASRVRDMAGEWQKLEEQFRRDAEDSVKSK